MMIREENDANGRKAAPSALDSASAHHIGSGQKVKAFYKDYGRSFSCPDNYIHPEKFFAAESDLGTYCNFSCLLFSLCTVLTVTKICTLLSS